jgi:hypothetical protein
MNYPNPDQSGYRASTPVSELKPPPANMTSAAQPARYRDGREKFALVITQKSRWRPGVEIDLTVRVGRRDQLEDAAAEIKSLAMRVFARLEQEEENADG